MRPFTRWSPDGALWATGAAAYAAVSAALLTVRPAMTLAMAGGAAAAARPAAVRFAPYGLLALGVVFPFRPSSLQGSSLLWAAAAAVGITALTRVPRAPRRMLLFVGPAALLLINALRPGVPLSNIGTWSLFWLVAFGVGFSDAGQRRFLVHRALPAALIVAGLIGTAQALGAEPAFVSRYFPWSGSVFLSGAGAEARIRGTFDGENAFGLFLAVAWPMLLWASWSWKVPLWVKLAASVPVVVALGATLSRASWFAAIVGLIIVSLLRTARPSRLFASGLALLAIAAAIGVATDSRATQRSVYLNRALVTFDSSYPANRLRVQTYGRVVRAIGNRPVLGHGAGQLRAQFRQTTGAQVDHAHNLYLQILLELGILGFVAFAAPVVYAFRRGSIDLRAPLIGLLVAGMLDFLLWSPQVAAFAGLVVGASLVPLRDP
jgi:O-antigen ligase